MFKGSITALLTPFRNDAFDEQSYARFIDWQISEGSAGLVPVGTTGETPTVTSDEHRRIIDVAIDVTAGRVPIIAGAGSNSTAEAVELTRYAEKAGADGILTSVPYYNKPNQEGIFLHFEAIARATALPVILYSVPGRTIVDIDVDTIDRLRTAYPNIVGVKDATGNMARAARQRLVLGDEFCLLSGDDMSAVGFNAYGGNGAISVTANVAPALCAKMQEECQRGDFVAARSTDAQLTLLHHALFIEPNPAGVKCAAWALGMMHEDLRLPMVPVSQQTRRAIYDAMRAAHITVG